MATAGGERPTPIIIAASLLLLQGVWGLLRAVRSFRFLQSAGHVDAPVTVLLIAGGILLVAVLSILFGIGLFRNGPGAIVPAIVVTILFALLLESSEWLVFGSHAAGIDLSTIASFLFTTSIVTLLVLGRRSYRTSAMRK